MRFHADLHVHSRFARATSRDLDLEHMAIHARKKGVEVVGTGDFTHPAWRAEIRDRLVPAEPGLFRLRPDIEKEVAAQVPKACAGDTRFLLSVEISTIYKKGDLTRKVHHCIYCPDFDAAERFSNRLAKIGNIASDGRPILGLDSRDLLEIALESHPDSFFIPAHIWTPWFAAMGSRSGFDSIDECYGDLSPHIFAVETGLSSDPPMNWRVSSLDRFRLVSSSDAHSPGKIGREATLFDTDLSYHAIRSALETGEGYVGTVEFFPEEGKYHLDGHRKCNVRLNPEETKAHGGRCPVCGDPLTVGVMHRVDVLADRAEPEPPATAGEIRSLVSLPEILSELVGTGPTSRAVERVHERLINTLGPELSILSELPLEDIERAESSVLGEAIARLRRGEVHREGGYDGEYGVIRLFEPDELRSRGEAGLFGVAPPKPRKSRLPPIAPAAAASPTRPEPIALALPIEITTPIAEDADATYPALLAELDPDQRAAASVCDGPLIIVAGPGSGKTRTITHRIAHLVKDRGATPGSCLAITFTRRAANEMKERLGHLMPGGAEGVGIHTFHSFGLSLLREDPNAAGLDRGFRVADEAERTALLAEGLDLSDRKARQFLRAISRAKRTGETLKENEAEAFAAYQEKLALNAWIDFDDLVGLSVRLLETPDVAERVQARCRFLSVDEFQDVDAQQYRLLRLLAPKADADLCVIGDPNQAIYGFRGADSTCFAQFAVDYPQARTVHLARNYRSAGSIVSAAGQVIAVSSRADAAAEAVRALGERIVIHSAPSARAEAEFVVKTTEQLIGGHSFYSIDSGRSGGASSNLSFSDIAVLYRTDSQASDIEEAFARSGLPVARHGHAPLTERPGVQTLLDSLEGEETGKALSARLAEAAERMTAESNRAASTALARLLALGAEDVPSLRERAAVASDADGFDPRADRISLLTLHASKGLEFPVVFIVGVEDGLLPLRFGADSADDDAEERRLFYVGMTRAKDRLFLCRAAKRMWRGTMREHNPSPYLKDIETALVQQNRMKANRPAPDDQFKLF